MAKKKRKQKIKKEKSKRKIKKPARRRPVFRSSKPKSLKRKKVKVKPKIKKKVRRNPKRVKIIKTRTLRPKKKTKRIRAKKITRKTTMTKLSIPDATIHQTKVRVIGIGGGGGSIISEISSRIKRASFVAANTDARALRGTKKVKRFQFGQDLTHGLGTGMNIEVGELAAQNEKEKIKKLFEEQDLCIIVICLGGGTGSGAGSIFAKISKKLNCLTYGIFTMPFEFEGEKKMEIARESLEKIKPHLNVFSVIPNERIFQIIDKDTPLKDALSAINERLAENLEGLIEMIYLPGLINIDFADLRTILAGRGRLAYLNTVEIEEPKKEEAAKKVISTPLYSYTVKGAKGVLYNVVGGKTLQLSEVSQISRIISDSVNKNAKIIFGISQSSQYQNKIRITLLATGCGTKGVLFKPPKSPKPPAPAIKRPQPAIDQPKAGKLVIPLATEKVKNKKKKVRRVIRKKPQPLKKKPKPKQKPKRKPKPKPQPVANQPRPTAGQPKVEKAGNSKPRATFQKKGVGKQTSQKVVRGEPKIFIKKKPKVSTPSPSPSKKKIKSAQTLAEEKNEQKIRRNGLQLKKVIEEEEKELLDQEKVWETPAILRRKDNN